jgi:NAD(P)-dependent dehydrogenase (short-subunit alcohol dehydrogenase family)
VKTALVTGAARGIGRAAADALQKAGLKVLRLDLQGEVHTTSPTSPAFRSWSTRSARSTCWSTTPACQNAVSIENYSEEQRARIIRVNSKRRSS